MDSGGLEMPQNTFYTTPDVKKYLFKDIVLVVWKYAQMQYNTFLTTPDIKKKLFYGLDFGGLEMHKNTFLTTPDVKKYIF